MGEGSAGEQRRSRAEAKAVTRQALLQAGLLELIEQGLDTPSLDAICARAGFTRGAFYVHFKDRDDFVVAVADWVLSGILDVLVGAGDESDLEAAIGRYTGFIATREWPMIGRVPVATHRVFELIARSEKLRVRFAEIVDEATARIGKLVLRAQEEGKVRPDLAAEETAALLLAAGIGALSLSDTGVVLGEPVLRNGILRLLKP